MLVKTVFPGRLKGLRSSFIGEVLECAFIFCRWIEREYNERTSKIIDAKDHIM